jgi:hypothetical protein
MKQCPECDEVFDDQKSFCDMDGAELVDQTDSIREALHHANRSTSSAPGWVTGAIGGLIGVILCVLLYIAFLAPARQDASQEDRHKTDTKETQSVRPSQVAVAPPANQLAPLPTASPAETQSPVESASPAASPAPPVATPAPAALNNGPIATGGKTIANGERAIIKLKDGSSVEADAAWEDAQGVWFRRSGLVSFVEKSRVDSITEPARRPTATEAKTPQQ